MKPRYFYISLGLSKGPLNAGRLREGKLKVP